jgi:hypothetical protein
MSIKVIFRLKKDPCYGCTSETGRSATCHGNCCEYRTWRKAMDQYNDYVRKQKESENLTIQDVVKHQEFMRKKYKV